MAAFRYEVAVSNRLGKRRVREYASDEPLGPGAVLFLDGRFWLVTEEEPAEGDALTRLTAIPARYRVRLRYPDGHEELGAFRRFRPDSPRLGHAFTTREDGLPVSWAVVDEQLAVDQQGEPYLDLRAERDYAELEGDVPDHELEHALAAREASLPEGATALIGRAAEEGLSVELVALDPGEEPDWPTAESYVGSLILEEVEDDLIELCGVDPDRDPRDTCDRLADDVELGLAHAGEPGRLERARVHEPAHPAVALVRVRLVVGVADRREDLAILGEQAKSVGAAQPRCMQYR